MPKTYAAKRLLEHGPLSFAEMLEITGWKYRQLDGAVRSMLKTQVIRAVHVPGCHRSVYELVP